MVNNRTEHPERYASTPTSHPAIAQSIFTCKEDGDLVYELELHDKKHADDEVRNAEIARLIEIVTTFEQKEAGASSVVLEPESLVPSETTLPTKTTKRTKITEPEQNIPVQPS